MKTLLAVALAALLAAPAFAQPSSEPSPKKNEVYLAIGDPGILFALTDVSTQILTQIVGGMVGSHITYGDTKGGFQLTGGYQRQLASWFSAGVAGAWAGTSQSIYVNGVDRGDREMQFLTLIAEGRAHWLRRPSVRLYTGIGIGMNAVNDKFVGLADSKDTLIMPAFQVVPIGIRVGRDWGGYAELALGTNGVLKAGLSRRL